MPPLDGIFLVILVGENVQGRMISWKRSGSLQIALPGRHNLNKRTQRRVKNQRQKPYNSIHRRAQGQHYGPCLVIASWPCTCPYDFRAFLEKAKYKQQIALKC